MKRDYRHMKFAYRQVFYALRFMFVSLINTSCEQSKHFIFAKQILHSLGVIFMRNDKLSVQSMDFAVSIINLVKKLKTEKETIISNQIGRSGTSIGANIREAQYAHGRADFIAKLQIALKEANETGYWLELLYKTNYLTESELKKLDSVCTSLRVMLIASINTAKENLK